MAVPLHPLLEPLAGLVGRWEGSGVGLWEGGFSFSDVLVFEHDGRPVLSFREATVGGDGRGSHSETGFVLVKEDGVAHMTVAEPSGLAEALSGLAGPGLVEVRSVGIALAPGAKPVTGVARRLSWSGDELVSEVSVALNGEALSPHTRSVLRRA